MCLQPDLLNVFRNRHCLRRFQVWPRDALEAVAFKFLREVELDEATRKQLVGLCQAFHSKIRGSSEEFRCAPWRNQRARPALERHGEQG